VTDWNTIEIGWREDPTLEGAVGNTGGRDRGRDRQAAVLGFFDLLVRDNLATTILQQVGHEENVQAIMQHRTTRVARTRSWSAASRIRGLGTFPPGISRTMSRACVLELADCIHHLTGRPARRLKLTDRGLVREGYHADLCFFDPRLCGTRHVRQPAPAGRRNSWVLVGGSP